jgi:hypothetical protein
MTDSGEKTTDSGEKQLHADCGPSAKQGIPAPPDRSPWPPCPRNAQTPEELHEVIKRLIAWAGQPSLRQMSMRAGLNGELPSSTLHDVLKKPHRLPSEQVLQNLVYACRADGHWGEWQKTRAAIASNLKTKRPMRRRGQ